MCVSAGVFLPVVLSGVAAGPCDSGNNEPPTGAAIDDFEDCPKVPKRAGVGVLAEVVAPKAPEKPFDVAVVAGAAVELPKLKVEVAGAGVDDVWSCVLLFTPFDFVPKANIPGLLEPNWKGLPVVVPS